MSPASVMFHQTFALLAMVAGFLMNPSIANAAELKVLSPQAMRPALKELVPQFERSSGIKVTIHYATASTLVNEIRDGAMADLAILSPKQIERLQEEDKIVEDSVTLITKLEFGLVIRKGATKPDVSTVRALTHALIGAKSIASGDPESSASGNYFARLIERLRIADSIKPKLKTFSSGTAAVEAVASGDADIGVAAVSAANTPGTELAGVFPAQAKTFNSYAIGILTSSNQIEAAKALASYIASPTALSVMKSKGFNAP